MIDKILKELQSAYSTQVIDREKVIYCKINEFFDLEVSGLDNRRKELKATIFVWSLTPGKHVIETISNITSVTQLTDTLVELRYRYARLQSPD